MDSEMDPKSKEEQYRDWADWSAKNFPWRAYMSWFSWGSPVGLGLFVVCLGVTAYLLHLAGLWLH